MISVSHKHKAIFWHIHKTGGTFIEQILTNYYDFVDSNKTEINLEELDKKFKENKEKKEKEEKDKEEKDKEDKEEKEKEDKEKEEDKDEKEKKEKEEKEKKEKEDKEKHDKKNKEKIEDMLKYGLLGETIKNDKLPITQEQWKTYFKFAFIRNPYDRAISSYEFNNQYDSYSKNVNNNNTFFDFYNSSKDAGINIFCHSFLSQHDNIKNTFNDIQIDYLAKFENMNEELIFILKNIGVPDYTKHVKFCNQKVNSTTKKNITEYYDAESLVLVNDVLKNDFEFLNYEKFTNVEDLNNFLVKYNEPKPDTNTEEEIEEDIIDIDINIDINDLEIDLDVLNENETEINESDDSDSDSDSDSETNEDSNEESDSESNDDDSDSNDENNIEMDNVTIVYNTISKITKKITKEEIIYFCSTEFNTKNQIIYLNETINFFDDKTDDEIRTLFTHKFKNWNMNKNEINFIINTNHRITGGFFENTTKQMYFELNKFFVDNHNYKLTKDDYNLIFKKLFGFFSNIKIYSKYSNSLKNESCFNIMNIMNSHASKMFNNNKKHIIELLQKEIKC